MFVPRVESGEWVDVSKVEYGEWADVPKVELGEERVNNVLRVAIFYYRL